MSTAALDLKSEQSKYYFELHADSEEIQILDGKGGSVSNTIPGLFSWPMKSDDARQIGSVEFQKMLPNFQFWSGYKDLVPPRTAYVKIGGVEWKVRDVKPIRTQGMDVCVAWLLSL